MYYEEFEPARELAAHVAHYWTMTVAAEIEPGFAHTIYPNGCISLVCTVRPSRESRLALVGPRSDAFQVPVFPGDRYWGVTFWPDAGGLVLGVAPRSLVAVVDEADRALGGGHLAAVGDAVRACTTRVEAAAAFDRELAPWVRAARALDPVVRAAVIGLVASRGEVSIAELADEVGLSARQLQRRFGNAVGLTPKQFARIRRFRSAVGEVLSPRPRTWSAVAAELGYADQSHLVRDFVRLVGLPPAAVAEVTRAIAHGRVTP